MNWPRLLACPDRPHLLIRVRTHKIHLLEDAIAITYPKVTFTLDVYLASEKPGSVCRRVSSDSHTIYGQRLYDWDCSFVDSSRFAVAYRDGYFGPNTLCLLLYDMSRRQFRTCCITADDYESEDDYGAGISAMRTSAQGCMTDYMLKGDRLLIVSPPDDKSDYRSLTVYRLSWPLETSVTLTPLWEPRPEIRIRVRPPADFHRRHFGTRSSVLTDDDRLLVFDGEGRPSLFTISYERFFSVDLCKARRVAVYDAPWYRCTPDTSYGYPPIFTPVNPKEVLYYYLARACILWDSSTLWILSPPEAADADELQNAANTVDGCYQWIAHDFGSAHPPNSLKLLSWPPPPTPFAVSEQGALFELDHDFEDECETRFIGYVGAKMLPPTLYYLAAICFLNSRTQAALEEFFDKSVTELRAEGYPFGLARLAVLKS